MRNLSTWRRSVDRKSRALHKCAWDFNSFVEVEVKVEVEVEWASCPFLI
ncbi:hypothetical protein [Okeania sp. KiyG1]|nr:hypothetical protein [Okeania sp. KiyG1]